MAEEIINAFFFQKSGYKIKISLSILNTVFVSWIVVAKLEFEVRKTDLLENSFHDFWNGLFLENSAIRLLRQKPQPGNHDSTISRILVGPSCMLKLSNVTMEIPIGFCILIDPDCHRFLSR